jgi:hypothetical protein
MVTMCKFFVWSVLCAAPWLIYMAGLGLSFDYLGALGWSIMAGAWILVVSVGMRFKGGRR